MDHKHGHEESHRQEREHKKADHAHPPGKRLSSLHPAWYVVVGVVLCGTALLIWMLLV
jgi:hypothetical protein